MIWFAVELSPLKSEPNLLITSLVTTIPKIPLTNVRAIADSAFNMLYFVLFWLPFSNSFSFRAQF